MGRTIATGVTNTPINVEANGINKQRHKSLGKSTK